MGRRQVYKLDLDVFEGHHARHRNARGEGIIRNLGRGVSKPRDEHRLAAIRRADQHHLARAFFFHPVNQVGPARRLAGLFRPQLRKPLLQVGLHFLRAFVSRDGGQHFLER